MTRCSACGPTARRWPRATPAPMCACSCCTAPSHRARRACATRRAPCARWPPSRGAPSSTASPSLRAVPLAAALAQLRVVGGVGGADAGGRPGGAAQRVPLRPGPRPQRGACRRTRCCAPATARAAGRLGPRRRRASHRARATGGRARRAPRLRAPRGSCWPTRRASRRGAARSARARRASCTWAPTSPSCPGQRDADPTLVTVAHLVARKRHADVVRALWLLRERHPRLRYLIVGDGPEREALARLAGELGVADRVELTGSCPRDGGAGPRPRRARVRHAQRRRGLRRRLRRGHGRRTAGDRRARRGRPAGDRGRRRRAAPGPARRRRGARGRARRPAGRARAICSSWRARARATVCGAFTWERAGARRCRPTRTRCGERPAGPLRHQPRPA